MPQPHDFCECEHESHFGDDVDHPGVPTEHSYAAVSADPDSCVKTPFGSFSVCKRCAEAGHMVID